MLTDEELALSYINGNNKAFDELLVRTQDKLFTYILFVVRDEDKANDLFQETFVKVITKLHQGRYVDSGKFSAWIMRIAHNVIMDWYREQRARNLVEPTETNDLSNLSVNDILDLNVENRLRQRAGDDRREEDDEHAPADAARGGVHALLPRLVFSRKSPSLRA